MRPRKGGTSITWSAATLTTADQILSSSSNALLLLSLAQVASVQTFGVIAILVAIVSTTLGFNRGALGTPVLLVSNLPRRQILRECGYAVTWSLGSGLVPAAAVVLVGELLGAAWIGVGFAVAIPVILAQDVLRMTAISLGRPLHAVLSDGLWTFAMLTLFVVNMFRSSGTALEAVYIWVLAGGVALVVLLVGTGVVPQCRKIWSWWRAYWMARVRFGFSYGMTNIIAVSVTVVALLTAGTEASASLRGASTIFGPISMLVSAFPLLFIPHARKSTESIRAQWHRLLKTSFLMGGLTIVGVGVLVALPASVGAAIMGATWQHALKVVPFTGIEYGAVCCIAAVYTFFQAHGMSKLVLRLRVLHTALQVGGSIVAGVLFGAAAAIAASLAITASMVLVIGLARVNRAVTEITAAPSADDPQLDRPVLVNARERASDSGGEETYWPVIDVLEEELNPSSWAATAGGHAVNHRRV